jgi:hypothetical protein
MDIISLRTQLILKVKWKISPTIFFKWLTDEDHQHAILKRGSTTAHTPRATMDALREVYGDRFIGSGLWPPCSSDFNM